MREKAASASAVVVAAAGLEVASEVVWLLFSNPRIDLPDFECLLNVIEPTNED